MDGAGLEPGRRLVCKTPCAQAPELALTLFEPIETDRRGEVAEGERPYFTIPVFNWFEGHFAGVYQRQYIESARRFAEVAPLTAKQLARLDMLDACANDEAFHVEIDFQPGDIQLVNNHVLLHDRTAFEDWPEPARRRHLLRLWLAPRCRSRSVRQWCSNTCKPGWCRVCPPRSLP